MDCIKRYIILVVLCISFTGCIKEPIYPIPEVQFSIDWSGISAVGNSKGDLDSAYVYLYPQFDYKAEPIVVRGLSGNLKCSAMPGVYKIIMHNAPIWSLVKLSTHSYDDFGFALPINSSNEVSSCDKLHLLSATDPMHTIEIRAGNENIFKLSPVTATKNLRFNVKTSNFGTIVSATGVISGVLSSMNASTWKVSTEKTSTVKLGSFSVKDSTLSGGAIDVLGVSQSVDGKPEDDKIILQLYIQNTAADRPVEVEVDLTDDLQHLEGDEIEVTLTVECGPEIVVDASVKQWVAGGELDFDITTHPDEKKVGYKPRRRF